ncbi:MAG: protoporphyrinogen oxidase [Salinivirgaceae bacterium]|jgi:oxygen-dependent protoporphyrinogen oxidase|nr:protoporphyrinogen oxidase [Salinivirgaceae bacterium]
MTQNLNTDICIIGAGITGLTLAYHLKKKGKRVTVIEKSAKVGGVIQTIKEDGFIYESGPNTGVLSNPELVELFEELDGVTLETANADSKKRWILKNNTFHALPSGLMGGIMTPLFSFSDKLRILGEPWRKSGTDPHETLADLVRRRMGKSFLNYAIDPFISGIYAGDPEEIITKYALPKLYDLEQKYGSFIRGAIKKSKEPKTDRDKKATKEVFSAENGLHNLVYALEDAIGKENIILNCQQSVIIPQENGFKVTGVVGDSDPIEIQSDKVVSTVPSPEIDTLIPFAPKEDVEAIRQLVYAKVVQVVLGYNNWKGIKLDAFGGLIPRLENRKVLGILFPSSIFKSRSPKDGALLSVFVGGMRHPEIFDLPDNELLSLALETVKQTLKSDSDPELKRVFRYKHAIPQYTATTPDRLAAIERIEKKYPGLILAGNIRDGIGMADRVKQAYELSKLLTN